MFLTVRNRVVGRVSEVRTAETGCKADGRPNSKSRRVADRNPRHSLVNATG